MARRELRSGGAPVSIGGRAFEIIEVLARSAGELVTKDDLMGRVWPGVSIEENTLQVHISALRKALGADRGLLKTASGRGYRLLGRWQFRADGATAESAQGIAAQAAAPPSLGNLPGAASEPVGRAATLQQVSDLLSAYRVATLTGPGGIGKTTVALEVARRLASRFPDGAWLADLAGLSRPALVASTVAGVLGLKLGREISAEGVARAISGKTLLLVLDNCEHLIDAAAQLTEALVRLCPGVAVLATSREVLRVAGEYVYRVPPLDVPLEHERDAAKVLGHGAIQLFVSRTQALQSSFTPDGEALSAVVAICRRLDGIPLAIEFAAARAAALGIQQVAARLDDRFELLTEGRRTALPRHQTLRATLDWSYELLPEAERRLLRRLSVFAGGFTLEAARAVIDDEANDAAVLERIANLVAKSLVALDMSVRGGRWRLLETIRAYAGAKLAESGEGDETARRHAQFFRDLLAAATLDSHALPIAEGMAGYVRELDNVRAALDWSFADGGDPACGIVLTGATVPVWLHLSLMVECRQRAERAQAALERETGLSARRLMQVHVALGMAEIGTKSEWTDLKGLGKALELAQDLGDANAQLRALWRLWSYNYYSGDWRAAQTLAERFARVAADAGDAADARVGDRLMGTTLHYRGNQPEARRHLERMLKDYVPPHDQRHAFWFHHDQRIVTRAMLARVLCLQGSVDQAKCDVEASLAQASAKEHTLSLRYVLGWGMFPIALMRGDLAAAERALDMFDAITATLLPFWMLMARGMRGMLAVRRGALAEGVAILTDALAEFRVLGWTMCFPDLAGALAEGLSGLGHHGDALAAIGDALARAEQGGGRWCEPELLRIKGELLLQEAGDAARADGADCLRRAIALAMEQGALLWQLRASISLVRSHAEHERAHTVHPILAPIVERFTEDCDLAELRFARAMVYGPSRAASPDRSKSVRSPPARSPRARAT